MIKVYCELGALTSELKNLHQMGVIELMNFPYEGRTKKMIQPSVPSLVTADCTYLTADSDILISECEPSDKYDQIRSIIGNHEMDVRHIDTAYKNGCQILLSNDKDDIVSKAMELNELLEIRVLHHMENWDEFMKLVDDLKYGNTDAD